MAKSGHQNTVAVVPVERDPLPLAPAVWAVVVSRLGFSPQQARIVEELLRGSRDKQIAQTLGLTVPTVRTYLTRIFNRVGVDDRVELILRVFAMAHRLATEGQA